MGAERIYEVEEGIEQMIWRKCILALLIITMLLAGTMQVSAWRAAKTKWVIGDIVYGNEVVLQKPSQTLFHMQTQAATDTEAFAVSFPVSATADGTAVLSEAGPSIAQTSDATVQSTDTGYYTANWCFNCFANNGGWAVGDVAAASPIRSSSVLGSGLIWPYMTSPDSGGTDYSKMSFKPYMNSSGGMDNISISPNTSMINNTSASTSSPYTVAPKNSAAWKSDPPLNYRTATKEEIQNASTMERVWRNANLANTIPKAYNGTVERPTWINPEPNVLKMTDRDKSINDSLNMTKAGSDAYTLFWDL